MFGRPDGVKAHVLGRAHAVELLSDYLVLALASGRMFKEMQHPELHMLLLRLGLFATKERISHAA